MAPTGSAANRSAFYGLEGCAEALDLLSARLERFDPMVDVSVLQGLARTQQNIETERFLNWDLRESDHVYLMLSGAAFSFTIFPDGRRHIDDVFGPGALCNFASDDIHLARRLCIKAQSQVVLLARDRFQETLSQNSSLRAACRKAALARRLQSYQRIRAVIALSAGGGLMTTLLDLCDEFALQNGESEWFSPGITYKEVGDLVGLSEVHISRTLSRLLKEGKLERRGRLLRIVDEDLRINELNYRRFKFAESL